MLAVAIVRHLEVGFVLGVAFAGLRILTRWAFVRRP